MSNLLRRALLSLLLLFPTLVATANASSDDLQPLDRIVAVVNDDVILKSELDDFLHTVRTQLRANHTALPPEKVLEHQGLERLIITRLQLQLAAKTGIRVDDETLNQALQNIAGQNRMTLDQFRQALAQEGLDYAKFRENIRDQIIISRLQQRNVEDRVTVSAQEVDNFLASHPAGAGNELYNLSHILIAVPDAASPEQIQAARQRAEQVLSRLKSGADFGQTAVGSSNGQHALEGGNLGWMRLGQLPEMFASAIKALKPGELTGIIRSPSGFHILRLNAVKGDSKHIVHQTHARHILIRTSEVVSDDDARSRLEQLRQRIIGGDDFAALARAHSDDTLSATKGGDLGWLSPGETVPAFEHAMDKLQPNQISEPIRTRFGWHIIQVLGRREFDDTEKYRRTQAMEEIRARKGQEALELWLRRLRDEAYVDIRLDS